MSTPTPSADRPAVGRRYLADWQNQPAGLIRSARGLAAQQGEIAALAARLRGRAPLILTGMGSSFNAVLALEAFLDARGYAARAVDGAELLHFHRLPPQAGVILASRSGESVEVVRLAQQCREQQIFLVAVTNSPESTLARLADGVIDLRTDFDHLVSLRMYTAIVQALLALGAELVDPTRPFPLDLIQRAWEEVAERSDGWLHTLTERGFFAAGHHYYCLGRGGSWASANEGRVKLEEAGKSPATALLTGAFRHGPQEVIGPGFHGILWLPERQPLRQYDLQLADGIVTAGAHCLVLGSDLTPGACSALTLELPSLPDGYRPVVEVVPVQIGAYLHALAADRDPDRFDFCDYVVIKEGGL